MIGELQRSFLLGFDDGGDGDADTADPDYFPGLRDDEEMDGEDEDEDETGEEE